MKELLIYIDYAGSRGKEFAIDLAKRFNTLDNIIAKSYNDYYEEGPSGDEVDWEENTIKAILKADIIIPLLSDNFLSYVSEKIQDQFEKVIKSKNKFLIPILLEDSDWSSFSWVVKSRIFPENGIALSNHTNNTINSTINQLIKEVKKVRDISTNLKKTKGIKSLTDTVFISHDHDDADFAELLKLKLEKSSLNSWIDTERLKIGQDWREEIDQGIENSLAIIVIMTPEARKSEYVTYEWSFAWGKGKKVFPLMLKQTQLHPRLESLQYLDFTNRTTRPWDKLIASIDQLKKDTNI